MKLVWRLLDALLRALRIRPAQDYQDDPLEEDQR